MNASKHLIYGLRDPRDGAIRYVGKSTSGMRRPRQHSKRASSERTHKSAWIRQLRDLGLEYEIVVLEQLGSECSKDTINAREIFWIALGRESLGERLTNITAGGDGFDSETARAASALVTAEKRAEAARKRDASYTTEKRIDAQRKRYASMTSAQCSQKAARGWTEDRRQAARLKMRAVWQTDRDQRREAHVKYWQSASEERREIARKNIAKVNADRRDLAFIEEVA